MCKPPWVPMPAGVYEEPVRRGPDFDDVDDDIPNHAGSGLGRVLQPCESVLKLWAHDCVEHGPRTTWSPRRSCVVVWDTDRSQPLFYKAGDDSKFDICWNPSATSVPLMERVDLCYRICQKFDRFVRAAYREHGREHEVEEVIAKDREHEHWFDLAIQ